MSFTKKVLHSVKLVGVVFLLSYLSSVITLIILLQVGSIIGGVYVFISIWTFICPVVIAPLIEEWTKYKSIKDDHGWIFIHILTWSEFLNYALILHYSFGMAPLVIIAYRLPAIILHYCTFGIQKAYRSYGDPKYGLNCSIILHSIFNFVSAYLV